LQVRNLRGPRPGKALNAGHSGLRPAASADNGARGGLTGGPGRPLLGSRSWAPGLGLAVGRPRPTGERAP